MYLQNKEEAKLLPKVFNSHYCDSECIQVLGMMTKRNEGEKSMNDMLSNNDYLRVALIFNDNREAPVLSIHVQIPLCFFFLIVCGAKVLSPTKVIPL